MLTKFKEFEQDDRAWDMFVTGRAGTGKTTGLAKSVEYCIDQEISYIVCAFTHKACDILRTALPQNAKVSTLHSWLKKRPTINQRATNVQHIQNNLKQGESDRVKVVFIDEYSMVGEQDLMDIRAMQDADYDAMPEVKVVWLGDPNQLPPVGDFQSVKPYGNYAVTLTKVHRQAAGNPLLGTLDVLVNYIEGTAEPAALVPNGAFIRDQDIVSLYQASEADKVMLAYTNRRVEELNALVQGYTSPETQDVLFSPTTKGRYSFEHWIDPREVSHIDRAFGDKLGMNTKFKTLEHLLTMEHISYARLLNEDEEYEQFAVVFGHYEYKKISDSLKAEAVASNRAIEEAHRGFKAAGWAKANPRTALARRRAKAWRDFLTFNDCVICLDFAHAMTVHKSQGSTYEEVYLDIQDLGVAANIDFQVYLKLMYVAISRASTKVVTN